MLRSANDAAVRSFSEGNLARQRAHALATLPVMSTSAVHCAWLPDHQLHVAPTLAHVDQLIAHISRIVHDYTDQGPLTLAETVQGDRMHLKVTAVAPIPEVLPRLVADALTQLRAALEHTLYAEV